MYRRISPAPANHPSIPSNPHQSPLYSSLNTPSFLSYPNTSYIANSEIGHKPEIGIKSEMTHSKKSPILGPLLV